ncbi:hypothetical protein [Allorhodopirellula solitaria]|uniref:Uncharacterized protein n=1 Tax=Allorhodopirellula solitaria TaxID=2527987 RepID=A0A5C5YJ77_9BACT|nr:hypothetical protein [Allorhodopirellula solitaria]TWT74924.1 hypothetical protein CA85_02120 [Allorhodopirellula solitaria]
MPSHNEYSTVSSSHRSTRRQASAAPASAAIAAACWGRDRSRNGAVRLWWTMAFAVAAWCLLSGVATAQKYETYQLDKRFESFKDPKKAGELERTVSQLKMARDLSNLNSRTPAMAKFYLEEYIPWKLTQKENLPELSKTIEELLKDLEGAQRMSSAGTRTLLAGTFVGMKKIAEGNYMPAARINAINALARLNSRPLDIAAGRPPLPLSYSYPVLFKLYADESENDGVRAAALHGMHHYVEFAFPAIKGDDRQALIDEMNELLAAQPPGSRNPEAHAYLQRFAVDILNTLRAPDDASLGTQLFSISTSEAQPDLIALYSASKLGGLDAGLQGKVDDPEEVTKQWSLRAFNAVESELARFASQTPPPASSPQPPNPITFLQKSETTRDRERSQRAGGRGSMAGGGAMDSSYGSMDQYGEMDMMGGSMDGSMMDSAYEGMDAYGGMDMMGSGGMMGMGMMPQAPPQPPEVSLSRRKLSFVLQQLLRGATGSPKGEIGETPGGLIAAVEEPQRAAVQEWVDSMLAVVEALNDKTLSDLELWTEALEGQRPALGALAGVDVGPIEDPDAIDTRPLLPLPGMGGPAPAELPGELPAGLPAEAATLPGLPATE